MSAASEAAAGTTAAAARPQSLHVICELTRLAACDYCQVGTPTQPCVSSGAGPDGLDGLHVARFAAARRRRLITEADFAAVTEAAGAFTNATIIYDQTLAGPA
jgi:hypothetical protein